MNDHTAEERVLKSCPEVIRSKLRWDIEKFSLVCPKDVSDNYGVNRRPINFSEQVTKIKLGNAAASASHGVEKKTEIEIKWILEFLFTPSNQQDQGRNKCQINLKLSKDDSFNRLLTELWSVAFKVSVIGQGNAVVLTRSATSLRRLPVYSSTTEGINVLSLPPIYSSELWANEHTHIVNDTLQLQVELAFCLPPQTKEMSVDRCHAQASHTDDIIAGMAQLWKSGKGSDLTITCRGKVFKVHSLFVKCRSLVLERMLESGMIESANKSIKFDDVDPADFEALLDYLYTGKFPEPGKGASAASPFTGLMQVADKYEVLKLRDYCFEKMIEHISLENAGEIAVFAHLHSAPAHVKNTAVNFCLRNWKILSQDVNFRTWTLQNPAAFLPGHEGTQ